MQGDRAWRVTWLQRLHNQGRGGTVSAHLAERLLQRAAAQRQRLAHARERGLADRAPQVVGQQQRVHNVEVLQREVGRHQRALCVAASRRCCCVSLPFRCRGAAALCAAATLLLLLSRRRGGFCPRAARQVLLHAVLRQRFRHEGAVQQRL